MNEFDYTDKRIEQVKQAANIARIYTAVVVQATNKRVIVRVDNEHHANILMHNLKYDRCVCEKRAGLKSAHWYIQVRV